ncbi:AMP-binding protein [Streptomyces sp. ICBB 8177]|uniref:class I adenylate-forming enzyme family protein n=1 Tax=Streptomyces sp. ICBB 8177 TaxID=563922 RepID=UPI000D67B104|nr:AMP-binding protein [Streptomyces sp. ICBB 8177]PWI45380.1 peptide synthetase [Streptomyces sp. ICBB 8177]
MVTAIETPTPSGSDAADVTVGDLLAAAVAARPDAPAVSDRAGTWTYAELDAYSRAFAAWLDARGVGRGERVLARVGNTRQFVAMLFGTLRHGAVFVPVNPAMKSFHLKSVTADSDPALVIGQGEDTALLAGLTDRPVRELGALWAEVETLLGAGRDAAEAVVTPDDLGLLIYTSGSTSAPKAVVSPHRPIVFAARAIQAVLGYRSDDVVLVAIPLSFDYGLYQVFLSVIAGAQVVLTEPDRHLRLLSTLHDHGVTIVPVVPSLAEMLLRLAGRDRRTAAVRLFTNTGAALTAPVIEALRRTFPAAQVSPMFGTTECKRITVLTPDGDLAKPGSVGPALPGTEVLILDEDGRALPPGEIGEIAVRGPHVMAGYWRAPQITAQRFRPDPVTGEVTLHTGDYGHMDADGHVYFQGRRDDLFKRRGVRMSSLEIESAALDIEGVEAAAAIPPGDGFDLTLFAVTSLDPNEVIERLKDRLEDAKVPAECRVLGALPLTPNGKTDRQTLRGRLTAQAA